MGDAEVGGQPFDPGFDQLEVRGVAEARGVQPLGFTLGNVPRSGTARGVRVLVMADQGLPVGVTRSLD